MMKNFRRQFSYLSRSRGSILIVTMWVLICFSILSVGLYGIVSSRLRLTEALEGRIKSEYLAKAACVKFKINRKINKTSSDTLSELGKKEEEELGMGKYSCTAIDEQGKVNINNASIDILARLPGFDRDIAKKVFESKLKPFHAKEELLFCDDITEEIYNNCRDLITVYGSGGANINTAGPDVFKTLGLDDSLISIITGFRAGADNKEGTADDGIFESPAEIISTLRSVNSLYEEQQAKLLQLITTGMLITSSEVFSLQIETFILERHAMRYNIVMNKDKILQWSEDVEQRKESKPS